MSSEQRTQALVGAIGAIGMAGLTMYLCSGGFSWWGLLTALLALGGIGTAIEAMQKGTSSSGGSPAEGLAALFNNMDTKGAENFAKMLNQMGSASAPAVPAAAAETQPAAAAPTKGSAVAPATLAPGKFRVVIVDSLRAGSMAVEMQSLLGAGASQVLHLAVMSFDEGGKDVLHGQDKNEQWRKLTEVTEPAILYVPRETLPYLKQQSRLWQRVDDCSEG